MLPLLPLGIASLVGLSWWKIRRQPNEGMTPERAVIYDTALKTVKDPDKLRALAKGFREAGLIPQAELLEKRALLRELPPDTKAARKEAFKTGMSSTNAPAIEKLADSFEGEGCTGAADALRKYAAGLPK